MKNKTKKLIVISSFLMIIILGLVFVLLLDEEDKKVKEQNSTTKVIEETYEVSPEEANESDNTTISEEAKEDTSQSDKPVYKINLSMSKTNEWESDGKFYAQFDIKINNKTSDKITNWKVSFPVSDSVEMDNIWNGTDKVSNGVMVISSAEYNQEISAKSELKDVGFIMYSTNKDELNELSEKAVLLIDDKEYKELDNDNKETSGDKTSQASDVSEEKNDNETTDNETTEQTTNKSQASKAESNGKTPFENHGKLSVNGTDIVDKDGNKFQLKGLSTHGIAWFPDYVNKDAFKTFRDDWGANLIRLAMYTDENMGYCAGGDKEKIKSLVCNGVDYATELGMYVIVDWHILHDTDPNIHIDESKIFFEEMTKKYSDHDNVIYEICNEPNGSTTWDDVKKYANEIIPIIRKNCPNAIIIVGTPTWSQDVDIASNSPIEGYDNIMYAIHFYAATHTDNIRSKVDEAHKNGLPVFVSEFSICDASGNGAIDYDQAEKWFDLINKYNLSYAAWNISNKDETSSIIVPACTKKSDWTVDELSDTGKWIREQIKN